MVLSLSVMGLLLSRGGVRQTPNLNTGQTHPVTAQTAPPTATNYRQSGFVLWPEAVIERDELCLWGHRKSAFATALQGRDGCRLGSRLSGAVVMPQHPPNQLLHHGPGH